MPIRPGQRLIQGLLVWAALAVLPLVARAWLPELAAEPLLRTQSRKGPYSEVGT